MRDTDEHSFFEFCLIVLPIVAGKLVLHIESDVLVILPTAINAILCDLAYQLTYYNKNETNTNFRAILGESWFEKVNFPKIGYTAICFLELLLISLCFAVIIFEVIYV